MSIWISYVKARNKKSNMIAPAQQRPQENESKLSGKMEAEHLYQCLRHFFKENPKNSWEKNELQDALKEQYMKLLHSDFTAKKLITDTSKRNQTSRMPLSYKLKVWIQHQRIFHRFSNPLHLR